MMSYILAISSFDGKGLTRVRSPHSRKTDSSFSTNWFAVALWHYGIYAELAILRKPVQTFFKFRG